MTARHHQVIERVTRVTPLGVAFWDTTARRRVADGLLVRVFPLTAERVLPPVAVRLSGAGVFHASGLPGLEAFEGGEGDRQFWENLPPSRWFRLEMDDPYGRYLPIRTTLRIPRARGLAVPECEAELLPPGAPAASPPRATHLPLFDAPGRTVPTGMASLRATLVDGATGESARSAVLEVREDGRFLGRGISDASGQVVVIFTYPQPALPPIPASPPSSPPGPPLPARPLEEQSWELDIRVRYDGALVHETPPDSPTPRAELCGVLLQPDAALEAAGSPPVAVTRATLLYGEELRLGSEVGGELVITAV
jgi:hypothetical protein